MDTMSIYTPRGLKIRLSIPYSFSLMARLFPEVTPFKVLKTTEGIEAMPDLLVVIEAFIIIIFFPESTPTKISMVIFATYFVGYLMKITGIFFIPLIVPLSVVFTYIQGYGLVAIGLAFAGYTKLGLIKTLVIFGSVIITIILHHIFEMLRIFWSNFRSGGKSYLTVSELDFLNAYKLHAAIVGVNVNDDVSQSEIDEENWKEPYHWLENNWPEITRRMPINDYTQFIPKENFHDF